MRNFDFGRFAPNVPLIAALLAPISTLLDVPALTQRWYNQYGKPVPDPTVSLVLSAIGLFLNVVANVLLIVRFSASQKRYWQTATTLSTAFWIGKTAVAIANLITFGALTRNEPGYEYTEGFYCAIASVVLAGVISIMLLYHYVFVFHRQKKSSSSGIMVRLAGRHFMLSIAFLFFFIGIQALVYSQIEHWAYFDGIYYSVVTMLTIGFGDFSPNTVAGKILVLPFAIVTISQLANEVSIIVQYFSGRQNKRRALWRERYETTFRQEAERRNPKATLQEEIQLIDEIARREELVTQLWDLIWSLTSLTIFWIVGAACFQAIENWTFWNALYFEIVFCLTIGYGDVAPQSAGGRVFFVLYSIAAVPLIASFVVQTVTGLLSTYSNHRVTILERERTDVTKSEAFTAHRDFVMEHRASFDRMAENRAIKSRHRRETQSTGDAMLEMDMRSAIAQTDTHSVRSDLPESDMRSEVTFDEESALIDYVLEHALRLEAIARRLLIDTLPRDSLARTILLADREVQLRDVRAVGGDSQKLIRLGTEEDRLIGNDLSSKEKSPTAGAHDNLEAIRRYRQTFAGLVAGGARLRKLEGDERLIFERTRRAERLATVDSQQAEDESRISSTKHKDKEKGYVLGLPLGEALRQKKRILRAVLHAEKDLSKAYEA